jgi:hypothetical protein
MAAATTLSGCPICDFPHPCPKQARCLRLWAEMMLSEVDDE